MELSYRGVNYENHPPTLEVTEAEICGKYRGQNFSFRYVRHIPLPPPVPKLMYRGVAHGNNQPSAQGTVADQPVARIAGKTLPIPKSSENFLDEAAIAHQANIRRSLERRLNIARAKGDESLLRLLEAESKQIAF
ncbi:MAG: DUF4278 domain-containing protein [Aphanothece sp. CMT-3BRIN-NPC111]|jgi:hypothetical protein|nr:DUF4278 domain-containing protein [Aphanothece sp. CMT-3BRIN-NPC111]